MTVRVVDNTGAGSTQQPDPSPRLGTFALVTAIAGPLIYVVVELRNWPLFTYHPGPNRVDWWFVPAVRDMGPAMYWYGWTASTILGAVLVGWLASMLPVRVVRRIPRSLGWITSILVVPPLIYGLRYYWRW